ncbi:hypothetical protein N7471_011387 [Penicillium samsonianum]|uniref:uncharacterized protein n=1 Tax=Penicillium samsonianum TaxID=1882272 RepID=UPI0025470647|nr:uncharacterized protein N7471_011387 [Penicillium samsonianum]KAJ6124070.1 hypothetical protein N7471_011387 [Penicillium samsonianum]
MPDNNQEGKQPLSAPPVLLPSQPKTTTYAGAPFINPWNRPASASSNLPQTQTIRAVPCISVCGGSMAEQSSSRHGEGYSVWGLNPACCYHPRQDLHRSCRCLHHPDDCCHCAGYPGTRKDELNEQVSFPSAGEPASGGYLSLGLGLRAVTDGW